MSGRVVELDIGHMHVQALDGHRIQVGTLVATKMGPGTAGYVITRAEVERVKAEAEAASA